MTPPTTSRPWRAWLWALALVAAAACRSPGAVVDDPLVTFEGTDALERETLLGLAAENLEDFRRRDGGKSAVDDAAFRLEIHYRDLGFPFALVDYRIEGEGPEAEVVFSVEEGPRVELAELELVGGEALDRDRLRALTESEAGGPGAPYSRAALENAVDALLADARAAGYRDAEVELVRDEVDRDAGRASVTVEVREGPRYQLRDVTLIGDEDLPHRRLMELVAGELGTPYTPRLAATVLSRLEQGLRERGYPDALAEIEALDTESGPAGSEVTLVVALLPGELVRISEVRFEGEVETRSGFLRELLEVRAGRLFDAKAVRESFDNLYGSGLFQSVRWRLEPEVGSERDLVWELEELPSLEVWIEPGYGSYDGLRARAGLRERNVLGSGRTLRAEGTLSAKTLRGEVGLTDPRFLSTELILDISVEGLRREEPSFEYAERAFETSLARVWSERFSSAVQYRFQRSDLLDDDIALTLLQDVVDEFDVASLRLSSLFDSRDNYLAATSGLRLEASAEWADRVLGSELDFLRFDGGATQMASLGEGTVLALHLGAGVIVPLNATDEIPLQERYFNGGESSVRSFAESELGPKDADGDPLGGEAFSLGSIELRQRLPRNFELALFADSGNVTPSAADFTDFANLRHAVGIGLRYQLPVGPLRLDFGVNPDPEDDEDEYTLHFAIGSAH